MEEDDSGTDTATQSTNQMIKQQQEVNNFVSPSLCLTSKRLIFLDRDGVINVDVGSPGVIDVEQLQLTTNAGLAIGQLKRLGYKVVIITNQSCVGKGLITNQYLQHIIFPKLQQLLLQQDTNAKWDAIYSCTSTTNIIDHRRKPSSGMIEEACNDFGISPQETIFIGDTISDMQAACSGHVPIRILVSTGYGTGIINNCGLSHHLVQSTEDTSASSSSSSLLSSSSPVDQTLLITKSLQPNYDSGDTTTTTTTTLSNRKESYKTLQSVMPFVYVSNLDSAVKWIVQNIPLPSNNEQFSTIKSNKSRQDAGQEKIQKDTRSHGSTKSHG